MTLRRLRESAGLSAASAARKVDHDTSWLSRIETGEVRPHPTDVRALLGLYGVGSDQAEAIIAVSRQARQRGWWQGYANIVPSWFATYVGMESEASMIRTYECQMVPGLLQTEAYARAAFRGAPVPMSDDEVERQVALRMDRQGVLISEDPPTLQVVIDEGAARRLVGGSAVMKAQLSRLVELSRRPNIDMRLLPYTAGAGFDGSFVVLTIPPLPGPYPDAAEEQVVYVDTLTGALYLEHDEQVAAYSAAFDRLRAASLTPKVTQDALSKLATDLAA